MARGTTLANLRAMLRAELGETLVTTTNLQDDRMLNTLLSNKQKWLASSYDWPFLKRKWDITCEPGTLFKTLPTTALAPETEAVAINFERPVQVEVWYNKAWLPVFYGIGGAEYTAWNSFASPPETTDPIQRWQFASNVDEPGTADNEVEFWPVNTLQQTVRFTGQRALQVLYNPSVDATTNDAYVADLDDMLLIYFVAAEMLARIDAPDAREKALLAKERLFQLRSIYPNRSEALILGRNARRRITDNRIVIATIGGVASTEVVVRGRILTDDLGTAVSDDSGTVPSE